MYRHSFDALSFVFGLLFIGMAFFAPARDWFPGNTARWIIPGAVLLLGAGLAISAVASSQSQSQSDEHPPV
jgi:predicted membrane protein